MENVNLVINVLDESLPVNYASNEAPKSYFCTNCGVQGVKLWRIPGRFNNHQVLCANCTCIEQKIEISSVDENGTLALPGTRQRTPQIGNRIPAIPKPENNSFWGYADSPVESKNWWNGLPLAKEQKNLN